MSWQLHQIVLSIHILLAITWVGGILFIGWGVYPVAKKLAYKEQQLFFQMLMKHTHWIFSLAGFGVIGTGIILGTVLGPLDSWHDVWNTRYGTIWVTALLVALFTLAWGVFVGYRQSMKVFRDNTLWENATRGNTKALNKAMMLTTILESVEVIGFLILLGSMMAF
ncbi:hypothetical protein [Oceanobacillus halotolerans]|uniref:hypothetical protein n=1 Tax=Oceanobacillus halotolerans TaxID=2663380 RepID=UPI00196A0AAC|nr:hypothetical protein [Oceanobacillus halotolerans]